MVSFETWNTTTQGGVLATKDSFATTHPYLTGVIVGGLFLAAFSFWLWQLNKTSGDEE